MTRQLLPSEDVPVLQVEQTLSDKALINRAVQSSFETKSLDAFDQELQLKSTPAATGTQRIATVLQLPDVATPGQIEQLAEQGIALDGYLGGGSYSASFTAEAAQNVQSIVQQLELDADSIDGAVVARDSKIKMLVRQQPGVPTVIDPPRVPTVQRRNNIFRLRPSVLPAPAPVPETQSSFLIKVSEDEELSTLSRIMTERGAGSVRRVGANTFEIVGDLQTVEQIADVDSVRVIDLGPPKLLPLRPRARLVIGLDHLHGLQLLSPAQPFAGLTGDGVRVAVFDSGIDERHGDFSGSGNDTDDHRFFKTEGARHWHGTHVAGIIGGNGRRSVDFQHEPFELRGVAPRARLGEFRFAIGNDISFETYANAFVLHNADVSNHSYVETLFDYGATSQLIDEIVRGDGIVGDDPIPARPQVWSAGNNGVPDPSNYGDRTGYYSVFTQAKNTISVGSIDADTKSPSTFSSLGPTFDGRIKPDIVAPGCLASPEIAAIHAPQAFSQSYFAFCGTSVAAPFVTGLVALMAEHAGQTLGQLPMPSTYKAILVETATDIISNEPSTVFFNTDTGAPLAVHPGPDFATGFGLVDAQAAIALLKSGARWEEGVVDPLPDGLDSSVGPEVRFCVNVADGERLSATIAWDDAPSASLDEPLLPKLVNDLDLALIAPDGERRLPWVLLPPSVSPDLYGPAHDPISPEDILPAVTGQDRLNNVEKVEVQTAIDGVWTVLISAHALPLGKPQSFSLAASHALLSGAQCEL